MLLERPPGADVIGEQFECTVLARRNGYLSTHVFSHARKGTRLVATGEGQVPPPLNLRGE